MKIGYVPNHAYSTQILYSFIWVIALAFAWNCEEPATANTVIVMMLVLAIAIVIINYAKRSGLVMSESKWLFAFIIKLTLSFLIVKYLWVLPLGPEYLRALAPAAVMDSNAYDFSAITMVHGGARVSLWMDYGINYYLYWIYTVFGVSVLYVASFNAILSLVGILSIVGILNILDGRRLARWQLMRWAMLLPFGSFYDATPAKEPLNNALFFLSLYLVVKLVTANKFNSLNVMKLLLASAALALVRLNVFGMLWSLFLLFSVKAQNKTVAGLTLGVLIFVLVVASSIVLPDLKGQLSFDSVMEIETKYVDIGKRLELGQDWLGKRNASSSVLESKVRSITVPETVNGWIVSIPLRTLIWLYNPFPRMIPDLDAISNLQYGWGDRVAFYAVVDIFVSQLSSWVLIFITPSVMGVFGSKEARRNLPKPLLYSVIFCVFVISNLILLWNKRHRVLVEPLLVALALWGYRSRNTRFYSALVACLVTVVLVMYWSYGVF